MQEFDVIAAGIPATTQEWVAAMRTPLSELPLLSESEEREVERLHLNAETRRRHIEMRRLAKERERQQGHALGAALQKMIGDLGSDFVVTSLQRVSSRTSGPDSWFIRLLGDSREVQFSMELETVHRLLIGSVTNKELDIFREQIAELVEPRQLQRTKR